MREPLDLVDAGDTFLAADTTKNKGKKKSKAAATRFTLSLDSEPDPGDIELDSRGMKGLQPGKSSTGVTTLDVPADAAPGSYHLLACADGGGVVRESKEENNCRSPEEGTIQVQAPGCFAAALPTEGFEDADLTDGCLPSPADATPACSAPTGKHEWWRYGIPPVSEVTFSATPVNAADIGIAVYTGNSAAQELGCSDIESAGTDEEEVTITHASDFPLVVFVQVFAYEPADSAPYTLDIDAAAIP